MRQTLINIGLTILAALVLVAFAAYVFRLGPFASPAKAIAKEQRKDAVAAQKIEAKGAEATAKDVKAATAVQDKAKAQVEYVTRTVRLSPTGNTPIPADRLDRLRTADHELCKLGVRCEGSRP